MSPFWQAVLSNSVVASGLAVVALLVGRSRRRAATAHLVWLAVLVKLLTPPLFVCEVSGLGPRVGLAAAVEEAESRPGGIAPTEGPQPQSPPVAGPGPMPIPPLDRTIESTVSARPDPWLWGSTLGGTWATLSVTTGGIALGRLRTFRRLLRDSVVASGEIQSQTRRLAARLGLVRVPEVRIVPAVLPPLVWSLGGSPIIVLPAQLVGRLGPDESGAVLAHELAHIRRGDHLVRFLELVCVIVFPWHPLVWLAVPRLRDLEEACCDATVLEACPDRPRAYALALVATLEFLSGRRVLTVPLRTAIRSAHPLAQRILMLGQTPPRRLSATRLALVAGLLATPLALSFAQGPAPGATPTAPPAEPTVRTDSIIRPAAPPAESAILRGQVVDKAGAPVADARVRLAVPAADMRHALLIMGEPKARPKISLLEVRTDAQGRYEFKLTDIAGKTKVSFDVLKPGFRRLVGTLMAGGDAREIEVEPGQAVDVPLTLTEPTRYYRGVVVDEAGQPIAGVQIGQYVTFTARPSGMAGGEVTATQADGTFELFNVDAEAHRWQKAEATSYAIFEHPQYTPGRIDDLHAIADAEQDKIRIVLQAGRTVGGTVLDAAGKPVAGALVAAEYGDGRPNFMKRKATLSDQAGNFTLRGLAAGSADLKVQALAINQKARLPLPAASTADLSIGLTPMALPADLKTYDVLGMKLADVTPEVQAAFDLYQPKGAVILDPGPNPARLGIGRLSKGNSFWIVGGGRRGNEPRQGQIVDVRDFVTKILDEAKKDDAAKFGVRVVYTFNNPLFAGTNTQHLKLTPDDLRELQALADRLAK